MVEHDDPPVYQPAEDSMLLAEAATERVGTGDRALDVGTGSGVVGERLSEAGASVVAADLNPHACRAARDRGLEAVRADLVAPFSGGTFDIVAFNAPYLPTDPDREPEDWQAVALSGGQDGREVIEPFLDAVGRVLAPGGEVVLLVSTITGVDAIVERAGENGFSAAVLAEESHPYETLTALLLAR